MRTQVGPSEPAASGLLRRDGGTIPPEAQYTPSAWPVGAGAAVQERGRSELLRGLAEAVDPHSANISTFLGRAHLIPPKRLHFEVMAILEVATSMRLIERRRLATMFE